MADEQKPRTTIKNLVDDGLLKAGTEVACAQPGDKGPILATVTTDGKIQLQNGQAFVSPSGAAKAARGVVLNGWVAWKEASTGRTLAEIRRLATDSSNPEAG